MSHSAMVLAWTCYGVAGCGYTFMMLAEKRSWEQFCSWMTWGAWLLHSLAILVRWIDGGFWNPPFLGFYGAVIFAVWTLIAVQLYLDLSFKVNWQASWILFLAFAAIGLALTQPDRQIVTLEPLLQGNWLLVHAFASFFGIGILVISASLAMVYVMKDKIDPDKFLFWTSFVSLLYLITVRGKFAPIHAIFVWVLMGLLITQMLAHLIAEKLEARKTESWWTAARVMFYTGLAGILVFLAVLPRAPGSSSSDVFFGMMLVFIFSMMIAAICSKKDALQKSLPSLDVLERWLVYCMVGGFAFLTLGLATGSVWSYYSWGKYWQWSPKEAWTLISWLFYGAILHSKFSGSLSMTGRRMAILSFFGFFVTVFTFLNSHWYPEG